MSSLEIRTRYTTIYAPFGSTFANQDEIYAMSAPLDDSVQTVHSFAAAVKSWHLEFVDDYHEINNITMLILDSSFDSDRNVFIVKFRPMLGNAPLRSSDFSAPYAGNAALLITYSASVVDE